jgi:hypothetical protein
LSVVAHFAPKGSPDPAVGQPDLATRLKRAVWMETAIQQHLTEGLPIIELTAYAIISLRAPFHAEQSPKHRYALDELDQPESGQE